MEALKNIVVIYHGNCYDGFGAAWVAHKKFGNRASYVPQVYGGNKIIDRLEGKEVYIIDFTYSKEEMLDLEKKAKRLVVIDHHLSSEYAVKSLKEYYFALNKSGCYLAFEYFFKDKKVPLLIQYISDSDTSIQEMSNYEEICAYIYRDELDGVTFETFNKFEKELDSKKGFEKALEIGKILRDIHTRRVYEYVEQANPISFCGYEVYAVNAPKEIRSELGYLLAQKSGKFALVFFYEKGQWRCSLRSKNGIDVSKIAEKFGGGGNKHEASFVVKAEFPLHFNGVHKKKLSFLNAFVRASI